jgi:hypothetical protein
VRSSLADPEFKIMAFAITIFISAFLLFQVQPVIAKYMLPWYGGSPAVWTTCLLFFQVGLLLGYTYAYLLVRFLEQKKQMIVHLSLLAISLFFLPITPDASMKPSGAEHPITGIITLLLFTVGIPYILISTTGPLVQHWYGKRYAGKSPYRLYALSNLGSLLGLLTYPFLFEPSLSLKMQTLFWSGGYGLFILVCGWCALVTYRNASKSEHSSSSEPTQEEASEPKSRWLDPLLWVLLSSCGSIVLLSSTNKITQDVAVIPFLWVLPLALYLVSFIIAFDSPRWYKRWFWIPLFLLSIPASILLLNQAHGVDEMNIKVQVLLYSSAMFAAVMICHGEMVRLKPRIQSLTAFYLMVSLGGALGGVFVNLVAPRIFSGFWEYHIGILLVLLLAGVGIVRSPWIQRAKWRAFACVALWVAMLGTTGFYLRQHIDEFQDGIVASSRSFYGVLRVFNDNMGDSNEKRKLYHGRISHGQQWLDPEKRDRPTSYYGRHSGVGLALRRHPIIEAARNGQPREAIKVGVIGLGVGTLAAYARPQDDFTFYEINSEVERIAKTHFNFLTDSESKMDVVLGDGRISLEKELKTNGSKQFDILAVDAFSGDAIPMHLLTKEAFELYFEHLKPDGILCIHISNLHINLRPVVRTLADHFQQRSVLVKSSSDRANLIKSASWVLVSNNDAFMDHERVTRYTREWDERDLEDTLWTDDYSSLARVLKH